MKQPQIGNIVLYKQSSTTRLAAIVTAVQLDDSEITAVSLNIKVFSDSPYGQTTYIKNVTQGDKIGQWQWGDIPPLPPETAPPENAT